MMYCKECACWKRDWLDPYWGYCPELSLQTAGDSHCNEHGKPIEEEGKEDDSTGD